MKKYAIAAASLFVFNNEIVSWLALLVLGAIGLFALLREMERGGFFK